MLGILVDHDLTEFTAWQERGTTAIYCSVYHRAWERPWSHVWFELDSATYQWGDAGKEFNFSELQLLI